MARRSINDYVQDGFMPKRPFPGLPHNNADVFDALDLAKLWGCRMRPVNSNDVQVSHPLLNKDNSSRQGLTISRSRADTSRALNVLLRRVSEEAERVVPKEAPKPKEPEFKVIRLTEPVIEETVAKHEPVPMPIAPVPVPVPEPVAKDSGHPIADIPVNLDELIGMVNNIVGFYHFRNCCTETFLPAEKCGSSVCQTCRDMKEKILALWESANAYRNDAIAARQESIKILDELTKPKAEPQAKPVKTYAGGRAKIEYAIELMKIKLNANRFGDEDQGVITRFCKATALCSEKANWSAEWHRRIEELDFGLAKTSICTMMEPDGKRYLVGARGWDQIMSCMKRIRSQPGASNG